MKHISKQAFLNLMRTRYAPFDDFLQNLDKGLLTTPGVNDDWSVKDHIALIWHFGRNRRSQLCNTSENMARSQLINLKD